MELLFITCLEYSEALTGRQLVWEKDSDGA